MPPRSNEFQRLVRSIFEQIKPDGASVTESAMLRERGSTVEREVDVLVETRVGDTDVRLAIECRDRARRDDIEWIDQLIGKYRDLPVDKVIAVSSSGVTRAAEEKATANRIEIRTLREALESDWPQELRKSQFANVNINVRPTQYCVFTDPEWPDPTLPSRVVFDGREFNKDEFQQMLTQSLHMEIERILNGKADHPLRRTDNLNQDYEMEFELGLSREVRMISHLGTEHRLLHIRVRAAVGFRWTDIPVRRHLFGRIGVTVATGDTAEGAGRILSVQVLGDEPRGAAVIDEERQ